jgi:hypothetical protein
MGKLGMVSFDVQKFRAKVFALVYVTLLKFSKPLKAVSQSAGDGQRPCAGYSDT